MIGQYVKNKPYLIGCRNPEVQSQFSSCETDATVHGVRPTRPGEKKFPFLTEAPGGKISGFFPIDLWLIIVNVSFT